MNNKIVRNRKRIIQIAHKAGKNGAHVGGSLSCVDILTVLFAQLRIQQDNVDERDRFILSKGHAALALYCVLEDNNFLTAAEVETFESNGTSFFAHAKRDLEKGIEFSGGSLSLGLSYAVGVALACKAKGYQNKVYVLLGDGECNEGLVWEAAMSASSYNLDNLVVIVDVNNIQSDGYTKEVLNIGSFKDKFLAFGFNVFEINGHAIEEIEDTLAKCNSGKPTAIIANTIKGNGVSFMSNNPQWHHGVVTDEILTSALSELDITLN